MGTERVKNAAVAALVAATLAGGVLMLVTEEHDAPPPAPGPAARARAAAVAGAPASRAELDALIRDRTRWLRAHPGDEESWAALGTAYAERGAWWADWAALAPPDTGYPAERRLPHSAAFTASSCCPVHPAAVDSSRDVLRRWQ
ncbi:Hypothetical protein SCLAV_0893 [Streptomyces clavuligerus]|uniref:Secreted protein n=1 Tax=Streptomyces clavuligerus TaxID=1901 RepID=E2PWD7_STRCL|nr:hypothetical protein [Streptomyces clavuligerus]EFG05970.1 Hypothetical protein SCLAV_0893 [Streptomyces clavuligerus]